VRGSISQIADQPALVIGDLIRPGAHINAVREVGKARPESAGSRIAMQGRAADKVVSAVQGVSRAG